MENKACGLHQQGSLTEQVKQSSQRAQKELFILDTNVLLHDPRSLFAFTGGVVIGIPFIVLEELDMFKKEPGERGRNAREVVRSLDDLRERGCLSTGVPLGEETDGSLLQVLQTPKSADFSDNIHSVKDNLIIETARELAQAGINVTLITKDINARVKAHVLGIAVQDYTKGTINSDAFYKGWIKLPMPASELRKIGQQKIIDLLGSQELVPNQFIILHSEQNEENYRLFRYHNKNMITEVENRVIMNNFSAKNVQQLMTFDLLLDDSIKLVTLLGPAGTGKTFLTLVAGMFKVAYEHRYNKFLVTRPVVALGADIGYLPGDLQEKLHYWMQPVHDNLDFIFSQMARGATGELLGSEKKKNRHKEHERDDQREGNQPVKRRNFEQTIESLQHKGILSLEAITYMRGRSIPYQFVFIDEVQNLTHHEVKTIVSRAGEGTKVILAGDPYQIDSPYLDFSSNGLTVTSEKMKGQELFGTVFLEKSERSELAKLAAELL